MMILLSLAVAPVLILLHAVYVQDRYEKEPINSLFRYLIVGGVSTTWVVLFNHLLPYSLRSADRGIVSLVIVVLIRIALVEEVAKWLALMYCALGDRELNEPFDWIVYSVSASLGFALVENTMYVLSYGVSAAIVRAFTAVPGHALNATLMGDHLARAAVLEGKPARRHRFLAIAEPTLWHGLYDVAAFRGSSGLLIAVLVAQYTVASLRVLQQQKLARSGRRIPPILLPGRLFLRRHPVTGRRREEGLTARVPRRPKKCYLRPVSTAVTPASDPQALLKQYRTLLEVSESILLNQNIPDLIQDLGTRLPKVVRFDFISLFVFDEQKGRLRLLLLETPLPHNIPPGYEPPMEGTISGEIWKTQQPIMIPDIENETQFHESTAILRKYGMGSACYVPLTSAVRKIGTLGIGVREKHAYQRADIEFLEEVGRQVASAVDNALHQEELKRSQRALQAERDHLRLMLDISNALVSKLKLNELFAAIAGPLRALLHQDYTSLSLVDHETKQLRLHSLDFPGSKGFVRVGMEIPLQGSWSGLAFTQRRPVRLHRPNAGEFPSAAAQNVVAEGLRSGCSVPLIAHDSVLGTLAVASTREYAFTDDDERLLIEVANQVAIAVDNALAYKQIEELKNRLAEEKLYLEDEIRNDRNFEEIIGESAALLSVLNQVETVAGTSSTALILGETGTGKELIARAIHNNSPRQGRTFVKLNCAAIPTGLLESELFGHERGAFTGAIAQKIGRFELANHGTLFLDEVGDIPAELQPKLLRVLQEGEFERLGSTKTIKCDVRLVAATNRDLKKMIEEREFRSDLYYRLNVFPIRIPALRERREDIPLLVRYFAQKFSRRMNRRVETISAEVMNACLEYFWPGNVRELENFVERGVILSQGTSLQLPIAELRSVPGLDRLATPDAPVTLESAEREHILKTLKETKWVIGGPDGAASRLGMKRTTLQSRMKKLGIEKA